MADLVLAAPHPLVGRHRYRDQASRTGDAGHFAERPNVIVEMLEDVERSDQIETAIGKRDGLRRSVGERHARPPRDAGGAAYVDVAGGHAAELHEGLGHGASSGADVDDARRRPQVGAQHGCDDLSASAEPPVGVLDTDVLVVEATLHRAPREVRPTHPDPARRPPWGSVVGRVPGRPNVADKPARSVRVDRRAPGDKSGTTSAPRYAACEECDSP